MSKRRRDDSRSQQTRQDIQGRRGHAVSRYSKVDEQEARRMYTQSSNSGEFESVQERRENFILQNQRCVLTLIRYPFHLRATAVARKRPRSFCQQCMWQVTPKHAYTLDPTKSEWADNAAVQCIV